MMDPTPSILRDLAPTGVLRAALNFGNIVLVQGDPQAGDPAGVTPALARELAGRLGVPVRFIPYATAGAVHAARQTDWDVCFLAIDPKRAEGIAFTAPYVVIEATYLVPETSPIRQVADADRPGLSVAVGENSAYDLYLTRSLRHATLVRATGTQATFERFAAGGIAAMGGIRQNLEVLARRHPGYRLLPDAFTQVLQAMGVPAGRASGAAYLRAFVEEMKRTGFVAEALAASGQTEAQVAPPAP